MDTVQNRVASLLVMMPETTTNDNLLLSVYWLTFDGVDKIMALGSATKAESILRAKRTILKEADEFGR